jgi:hypothetical protein
MRAKLVRANRLSSLSRRRRACNGHPGWFGRVQFISKYQGLECYQVRFRKIFDTCVANNKDLDTLSLDAKTKKIFLPLFDRERPPPATTQTPNPRGKAIPGTFRVLVFGR